MAKTQGRHRAARTKKRVPIAGAAGLAAAGAAVLGMTPTLSASPELTATVHYLPGTKIGQQRSEVDYVKFADAMINGTGGNSAADGEDYVDYPGSFWPVTEPYFQSPTWNASVTTGVQNLESAPHKPAAGDTVFGFSQGAVVASKYKYDHRNDAGASTITYVLVENPNRPNGGLLQRFNGLYVPILDVSFNGATQPTSAHTIDIARQYDGWADFPTYPLNFLATANAILGIVYVHGDTQDLNNQAAVDELENLKLDGDPTYYQDHPETNTEYYLIPTERLPLLMPFTGIVPDQILDAADAPLRYLVELGYDRGDYSKPTTAGLFPAINPVDAVTGFAAAVQQGVAIGTAGTAASTTPATLANSQEQKTISAPTDTKKASLPTLEAPKFEAPKFEVPKIEVPKLEAPKLPDALKLTTRAPRALADDAAKPDADSSTAATGTTAPRALQKALKALAPKKDTAEPGAARKKFSFDRPAAKRTADKNEPATG